MRIELCLPFVKVLIQSPLNFWNFIIKQVDRVVLSFLYQKFVSAER